MVVQMVESMGLFVAIGDIVDKDVSEEDVVRGMRANGLASAIAGMFAAFPFIAFMENVGLVILTGVRSRWVVAVSGVLMCVVALVPKMAQWLHRRPLRRSAARHRDVRRGGRGRCANIGEGGLRAQSVQRADRGLHDRHRADSGDGAASLQAYARLDAAVPA
jgi:Xanthine/uracil permeases